MAITLKLLPAMPVVDVGKTQKFTATITDAPVDSTTVFEWKVNKVVQQSTINTMDYKAVDVGTYSITVKSTTSAEGAEDIVLVESTTLTAEANTMTARAVVTVANSSIKIGDEYSASVEVLDMPPGAAVAYLWNTGETTKTVKKLHWSMAQLN